MNKEFIKWDKKIVPKDIEKELIGKRVRLLSMYGEPQMKPFTYGTIMCVDDANQIHVTWKSGNSLALIPEKDEFEIEK